METAARPGGYQRRVFPSRYRQGVRGRPQWRPGSAALVRIVLVAFVVAWVFGPHWLRSTVPIWLAFAIAAGLEVNFVVRALRTETSTRPRRDPQEVDLDRYGYAGEGTELLLVRDRAGELWVPYAGETGDELEALLEEARAEEDDGEPPETVTADRGQSPIPRFLGGVAVLAALAALVWAVESRTGWGSLSASEQARVETRLSDEASLIAGKRVSIRCDETGEHVGIVQHADGVATVGGTLAYLTPERCFDLHRLAFEDEVTSSRTARAIAVLAHEAWHLHGLADEGETECYALQTGVELGRRLGLPEKDAAQMMRQQLVENLGRRSNLEYIVPAVCRNGAALDLNPGLERFP